MCPLAKALVENMSSYVMGQDDRFAVNATMSMQKGHRFQFHESLTPEAATICLKSREHKGYADQAVASAI